MKCPKCGSDNTVYIVEGNSVTREIYSEKDGAYIVESVATREIYSEKDGVLIDIDYTDFTVENSYYSCEDCGNLWD